MAEYVPLDALKRPEMYVVVFKAIGKDVKSDVVNAMTDALMAQQGGFDHFLAQAWEQGKADYIMGQKYPFIGAHLVNPYENPVSNPDDPHDHAIEDIRIDATGQRYCMICDENLPHSETEVDNDEQTG